VDGARITLEAGGRVRFAITCGIFGWMVHTVFIADEARAVASYASMKEELARILDAIPLASDPDVDAKMDPIFGMIEEFVERYHSRE
jgi:hypothetical protein